MKKTGFKDNKNKRDGGHHLALPRAVIFSDAYRSLSHASRSLLIDIAIQYRGANNGALVACGKYLRPLGWSSNQTVTRCLGELCRAGLLVRTRMGARPNKAAWYAATWWVLDRIDGLEIHPADFPRGEYRKTQLLNPPSVRKTPHSTDSRPIGHGSRTDSGCYPALNGGAPTPVTGDYLEVPSH